MKVGLLGLPNSGKTTIFNALTNSKAEVSAYSNAKAEPNLAVIDVGDLRVTNLAKLYKPKKVTYATLELMDFAGLTEGSAKDSGFSPELLRLIENMDALAIVVRNFKNEMDDAATPLTDIEQIEMELILFDMIMAENRLERIDWADKRGKMTNEMRLEQKVLAKILAQLNRDRPIRDMILNNDEAKVSRGFQFLSQKPMMVILNSDESNFGKNDDLMDQLRQKLNAVEFAGAFEMDLSRMDEEEARLFMDDLGIQESARNRLTQLAYKILGYISFFTVGTDEVRAWNIRSGDTAMKAAGAIHTDLMRGFIRAECFSYENLIEFGSEKGVRDHGKFRLEGKEYLVKDGDILSIRFNV